MAKAKKKRPAAKKRTTRGTAGASERPRDDAWRKLVETALQRNDSASGKPRARAKSK